VHFNVEITEKSRTEGKRKAKRRDRKEWRKHRGKEGS